ncbi:MAG: site-specific integrase, partial [Candidatus Zixiibacteriota bacterium]
MLQKALTEYLKGLAVGGKHAARTIESYRRDLKPWVGFLQQKYRELPSIPANDPLLLRLYLRERLENGVSNRSLARFLSSLAGFQRFLSRRPGSRKYVFRLPRMKYSSGLPSFLPQKEAMHLLNQDTASSSADCFRCRRDFVMIALLYATGIRREELARITLADIDLKMDLITVTGKGNKVRVVPIGEQTVSDVRRYLKLRREFLTQKSGSTSSLFVNRSGKPLG